MQYSGSMAEHASQEITIEVRAPVVLEAVLELDEYLLWIPEITQVIINERDIRACLTSQALGKVIKQNYLYSYDKYPDEISWKLESGDMAKSLEGRYIVKMGTQNSTTVQYELTVDMDVSIPGFMKRKAAKKIVSSALENLKTWCEKQDSTNR